MNILYIPCPYEVQNYSLVTIVTYTYIYELHQSVGCMYFLNSHYSNKKNRNLVYFPNWYEIIKPDGSIVTRRSCKNDVF